MQENQTDKATFDFENNSFIVPKALMEELLETVERLSPETYSSEDLPLEEASETASISFPRNRAYCCEFYPVANGDPKELMQVGFRSFPWLADARCAAIAAQYAQISSNARQGNC